MGRGMGADRQPLTSWSLFVAHEAGRDPERSLEVRCARLVVGVVDTYLHECRKVIRQALDRV